VNALANPAVGEYINEHFVSSFQKVATFQIVNGQKQGGNVAAYFCAPDGRVIHTVAGPVNADQMLHEARWVVESVRASIAQSEKSGTPFKAIMRRLHAERLRTEHGLVVEAATFDPPSGDDDGALSFRDPSGRPIVPILPPPPIEGPDVSFRARQDAAKAAGAPAVADREGRGWALGTQGQVHRLLAAHGMVKIERVYGSVMENILGEKVTTRPVLTIGTRPGNPRAVCLHCEAKRGLEIQEREGRGDK